MSSVGSFALDNESPEEKLEQRFLILRHFLARVPLPLAKRGVGAIPGKITNCNIYFFCNCQVILGGGLRQKLFEDRAMSHWVLSQDE